MKKIIYLFWLVTALAAGYLTGPMVLSLPGFRVESLRIFLHPGYPLFLLVWILGFTMIGCTIRVLRPSWKEALGFLIIGLGLALYIAIMVGMFAGVLGGG